MIEKPSVVEVVRREGVELRQRGNIWWGLCPFHSDKNPSFKVDAEKNLWHCFGCGLGGDAISFIEKFHHVDFKQAIRILGINGKSQPPPPNPERERKKQIDAWAEKVSREICDHLREVVGRELSMAILEQEESLQRQWEILSDMDDDLNKAETRSELWENREMIDAFIESLSVETCHRELDEECDAARDRDRVILAAMREIEGRR